MDSGYLDAGYTEQNEGGERAQRDLCTIAHVMKLRLVAADALRSSPKKADDGLRKAVKGISMQRSQKSGGNAWTT